MLEVTIYHIMYYLNYILILVESGICQLYNAMYIKFLLIMIQKLHEAYVAL